MDLLKRFIKHYWFFLLVIVLISYGQILGMGVWKDDNAIFFKFDHVYEQAGFFGKGLLGAGPYKFSITPYYPIYHIFGNKSFVPYYVLILIFYYISTLCVYFLFSKLFSPALGKISAFLFAAGYISSEGFFWLANSMLSHMSILSITLIIFLYYLYFSKKKVFYYLLTILFFWLSTFFVPLRTFYFVAIVLAFELIYSGSKKLLKSLIFSLLRFLPFLAIFHYYFTSSLDSRALSVKDYIISVIGGEFYKTFNFFSSISNLFIPDNYISYIFSLGLPRVEIAAIIFLIVLYYVLFNGKKKRVILTLISSILSLAWFFVARRIFNSSLLSTSREKLFIVFLGGIVFYILFLLYFLIEDNKKKLYLFLSIFFLVSISTYAAYEPTAFFGTTHRYFTNSFFAIVGILGLVYLYFRKRKDLFGKFGSYAILIWGLLNIANSVKYQNTILKTRSIPVANFYKQLKEYLPEIHKGDVLYFDVNRDAQNYFTSAFSVSSMPETTAVAWRYDVDRYDFEMYTDFDELASALEKDRKKIDSLYTFYYDKNGLTQTTAKTRNLLITGSTEIGKKDIGRIYPLTPILLTFKAQVVPDTNKILTLYANKDQSIENKTDINYIKRLTAYLSEREKYYNSVKVKSLSEWKYQEIGNIIDNNTETSWRGHRIWWHDNNHEQLIIDLGRIENINRLVWVNWQHLLTPTAYSISVSKDGYSWKTVIDRDSGPERKDGELIIENFEPSYARFVNFDITEVLTEDSPAIREVEVVKSGFSDVDIGDAFAFRQKPLEGVQDLNGAKEIISFAAPFFKFNINWKTNKGEFSAQLPLKGGYNQFYTYSLILDPGGTKLYDINVNVLDAPLSVTIESLSLKNLNLFNMQSFGLIKRFSQN